MSYSVKILLDSVAPTGIRLTTWELSYPRFVHSELMTHRVFSRNAASSRAIPIKKMIERVRTDPLYPKYWGKNQKGMQALEELTGENLEFAKRSWDMVRETAIRSAALLDASKLHKQLVNRVLEPFMFITTIVTATEYDNWFGLRAHEDAQPEIGWMATEMLRQYKKAKPNKLKAGEWHRPLLKDKEELEDAGYLPDEMNYISAGRCARVSYLTHDGKRNPDADCDLANGLVSDGHMSPLEHVAVATDSEEWYGNFRGWRQLRKTIPEEDIFVRREA